MRCFWHVQLLQKLKASPAFLAEAKEAQEAYAQQMELADDAVDEWVARNTLSDGQELSWICRPNAVKVRLFNESAPLLTVKICTIRFKVLPSCKKDANLF